MSRGDGPAASSAADSRPPRVGSSFGELLSLGVASGIAPCPGGMIILSIGLLYPERFLFVLFLILIFSLGLGAVLIALGVLVVTGRSYLVERSRRYEGSLSYLPALSALFIAALGTFYLVRTFVVSRPEVAGMLDALAEWVRGA